MEWRRLLLAASIAALATAAIAVPNAAYACTPVESAVGACPKPSVVDNERVDLELSEVIGGDAAQPVDPSNDSTDDSGLILTEDELAAPAPPAPPANCSPTNTVICAGDPFAPPTPVDPGEPTLTLRDIASFQPAASTSTMQPEGWAVVGLPTNFIAAAQTQTIPGTVLARAVEVRFTPIGYRWEFSDGVVLRSRSGGASWEDLGAREFTETETTRRFEASGHVSATLVVTYTAEYRFAGSVWRTITGTLDRTGQARDVLVGELDTVLTDGDCVQNPRAPGC